MSPPSHRRVIVAFNRDFEGSEADPENKAREDIKQTAEDVLRVLRDAGFEASALGVTGDLGAFVAALREQAPDLVFNLCESIDGDNRFECLLPMILEVEGVPYTGSASFALGLALHKDKAKEVLRARGVPVPRGGLVRGAEDAAALRLRFPAIVKPAREDASVGISHQSVVADETALAGRVAHVVTHYAQPAVAEEYVDGREIYVSLLGRVDGEPEVFPFYEIDFSEMPADRPRIVSFEAKWVEDSVDYRGTRPVPCEGMSDEVRARIAATARAAFDAIDLRDYGRVDVRLAADGTPYVIDVNPNCDLSAQAGGYAKAARAGGLAYKDVILRLVELALSRSDDAHPKAAATRSPGPHPADRAGRGEPVPPGGGVLRARAPRRGAGPT